LLPADYRLQRLHAGPRRGRPAAHPDADGAASHRGPTASEPAAHLPAAAAVLDLLRLIPAGRTVPVLDRVHPLFDHSAIPDRRLGLVVPDLRLDSGIRR